MTCGLDTQVLVAGAGPTGLLLAAELYRRGVDCTLIDSREAPLAPSPIGRLEPSLADELGVADVTVLAVRPDGHVGLRSDGVELRAHHEYIALI